MAEDTKEIQKAYWERARKGVLKFVADSGGSASLKDMHNYSESKYFIAHQRFSQLMESFVADGYVEYDSDTMVATITDAGRKFTSTP